MTAGEEYGRLQDATFARSAPATTTSYPPERRLTGEHVAAVLGSGRYAVVATTRGDGRPHATPTSFRLVGTELWLPTVAGSVRGRNVRARPWLSLVVAEGVDDEHLAVVVEGPVRVADAPPEGVDAPEWAAEWLVLTPERVLSYAAPGWRG
ncbi:MAG TPA: pyridoxamine 5'-phosphate oxidase family protein [Mycobacteriales bacterium]|nr:pyridoxamine 5'-phosphate oxidase family protein [Mycobacteriales bacterium]